jgi:hypothetical protein
MDDYSEYENGDDVHLVDSRQLTWATLGNGSKLADTDFENSSEHFHLLQIVACTLFVIAICFGALNALVLNPLVAHRPEVRQGLYTVATVLFVYASSVSVTLYDKWLISDWDGGFRFPLGIVSVHFAAKSLFALALLTCNRYGVCQTRHNHHKKPPFITPVSTRMFMTVLLPMGVLSGFQVAFRSSAINGLSVSAATIAKSCSLPLNMLFSVALGAATLTKHTGAAVAIITIGFVLATFGNTGE